MHLANLISYPTNAYALPDGRIVRLGAHCTAAAEKFQIGPKAFVMAVRVDGDDTDAALKQAREIDAECAALTARH